MSRFGWKHLAVVCSAVAILSVPLLASSQRPPLALSYKSATTVIPGPADAGDTCSSGFIPIDTTGSGIDSFGSFELKEDVCVDPTNAVFKGTFKISHEEGNAFSGVFNGQFIPSGQILEVHATWRVTNGSGPFLGASGAGEGHGVASVINGAPGPGMIFLDGSLILPNY